MKKFLFTICCYSLLACETDTQALSLAPQSFDSALNAGNAQLLDVRTVKEFQSGHLRSALQADWKNQAEFREHTSHLDKNKPVLVYCAAGPRSAAAGAWLREQGYIVTELQGGFEGWKSAQMPFDQATDQPPVTFAEYKVLTNLAPVVLVDIGAEWCPPCKKMDPVIDQLKNDPQLNFRVVKIDAGMQAALMSKLNAEKIPTFIIYRNGSETWRKVGIVGLSELKRNLK